MTELEKIVADCHKCADEYEAKPGLTGAQTMIDLYRTIARLASCIKFERARNPTLPENQPSPSAVEAAAIDRTGGGE